MASYPSTKQGLAVIINNSFQKRLDYKDLIAALTIANYEIVTFEDLNTLDSLTNAISQLQFLNYIDDTKN